MLSIGAMASGQGEYYLHLAREDYYLEGGEPPGKWQGRGASTLGLQGEVAGDQLAQLLEGFSAVGHSPLVQNAGKDRHQPGWDLTFSAPKSVSVLWSQADKQIRHEIQQAHAAAVKQAISYIEDTASFTRRGRGGHTREPAGLIVAMFEHGTSRAVDPQLHSHCLVLNIGSRSDGTTGSLLSKPLYLHKMATGTLYRAELACQLERRLGVICERTKSWFEIAGIPKAVMECFSKRRAAIEERLSAQGLETASAAAFAALTTRKVKDLVPPREQLFGAWQNSGKEQGFDRSQIRAMLDRTPKRNQAREVAAAFREAVNTITASQSHFSEKDFIRHAAEAAQGRGLGASVIVSRARQELEHSKDFVRLGATNEEQRYTTLEMMRLERELLKTAQEMKNDTSHRVRAAVAKDILAKKPTLTAEQRAAFVHATQEAGAVRVISGMAGTGKTYMLRACREAWEKAGFKVAGAALSGKAAQELQMGSGIVSDTLAKRLWDLEHGGHQDRARHDVKQTARPALSKPTHPLNPFNVDKRTIVVLDEAGMVGTRQMERLIKAVERGGGKLVLVGDAKQLQAVEAGGPFAALGKRLGQAELTDIIRQDQAWARQSVHELARGESAAALRRFAEHGLLSISKSRDEAIRAMVSDWKKTGLKNPKENLIFVGTNLEADRVNGLCQVALLKRDGSLPKAKIKVGTITIHGGDRVLCTKKSRVYGVENGDTGTAVRIDPIRRTITIELDRGRTVTVPVREYEDLRLGYAVTTHKGQGATVDRAYVLIGGSMQDREISYVQASRARHETRLYTDELEAGENLHGLVRQMSQSRVKTLAHDVVGQRDTEQTLSPEITR